MFPISIINKFKKYTISKFQIFVYKNGEELSEGKRVALTRRQFKHWIKFLDHLTEMLHTHRAVRKLFTINGVEIQNVSGFLINK